MDERSGARRGSGRLAAAPSRGKARRSRLTAAASLKKFGADEERDPEWRSSEPPRSVGPPEPFHERSRVLNGGKNTGKSKSRSVLRFVSARWPLEREESD